jgi:hypothetical protein
MFKKISSLAVTLVQDLRRFEPNPHWYHRRDYTTTAKSSQLDVDLCNVRLGQHTPRMLLLVKW